MSRSPGRTGVGAHRAADGKQNLTPNRTIETGIRVIHQRSCASYRKKRCDCVPGYEASTTDGTGKRQRKNFPDLATARSWRADMLGRKRHRRRKQVMNETVDQVWEKAILRARTGSLPSRRKRTFTTGALDEYERQYKKRIGPRFGKRSIHDVSREDVQELVDEMLDDDLAGKTVRNALMPLRLVYRVAIREDPHVVNPCRELDLPADDNEIRSFATRAEAMQMLHALQDPLDQAIYATAFFAGPRLGELRGQQVTDLDFERNLIHVRQQWKNRSGLAIPKSKAGIRTIPMAKLLRQYLITHLEGRELASPFSFDRTRGYRFEAKALYKRARKACEAANVKFFRLHEARHTCASFMIAAGVNPKALSTYLGHESIQITYDLYGHLMPGNEEEAARLLDKYLSRRRHNRTGKGGRVPTIKIDETLGSVSGSRTLWTHEGCIEAMERFLRTLREDRRSKATQRDYREWAKGRADAPGASSIGRYGGHKAIRDEALKQMAARPENDA